MDLKYFAFSSKKKSSKETKTQLMLCVRRLRIGSCFCVKKNLPFPNVYCRHVIMHTLKIATTLFQQSLSLFFISLRDNCAIIKTQTEMPFTSMLEIAYACRSQIVNRCGSVRVERQRGRKKRQIDKKNSYPQLKTISIVSQ